MRTQADHKLRVVALSNLEAMCARVSQVCHKYWMEVTGPNRVRLWYSNPDEYAADHPVSAILPAWKEYDGMMVVLSPLSIKGGGDYITWDDFEPVVGQDTLWRSNADTNDWKTEAEIRSEKGDPPLVPPYALRLLYHSQESHRDCVCDVASDALTVEVPATLRRPPLQVHVDQDGLKVTTLEQRLMLDLGYDEMS